MKAPAETHARPAGKSLISGLDAEVGIATLMRPEVVHRNAGWKYLLVVTGRDERVSQRCNKSVAGPFSPGQFCDFEGGTLIKGRNFGVPHGSRRVSAVSAAVLERRWEEDEAGSELRRPLET